MNDVMSSLTIIHIFIIIYSIQYTLIYYNINTICALHITYNCDCNKDTKAFYLFGLILYDLFLNWNDKPVSIYSDFASVEYDMDKVVFVCTGYDNIMFHWPQVWIIQTKHIASCRIIFTILWT